jgi:hypothetical protein
LERKGKTVIYSSGKLWETGKGQEGVKNKTASQARGSFTCGWRVVVGTKKSSLILAEGFHAGIVRVNKSKVNIKFMSRG